MLTRISDDSYQLKLSQNGNEIDCIITLKNRTNDQALNTKIVKQFAKKIINQSNSPYYVSDDSTISFQYGSVSCKAKKTTNKLQGLISRFFPIVRDNKSSFHQEWELSISEETVQKARGRSREYTAHYQKPSLDNLHIFKDPFTSLATIAFQKLEPSLMDQDNEGDTTFNTRTVLVLNKNNELRLMNREKNLSSSDPDANSRTVEAFRSSLIQVFGEKKVIEIQKRYLINFEAMIQNNGAVDS